MAEIKKYSLGDKDKNLKRKDAKKNYFNISSTMISAGIASKKKVPDSMVDPDFSNVKVQKKLPVAVDIIAGILLILIVIGAIISSYFLFRYYSNDYDNKKITYDILVDVTNDPEQYKSLIEQDVFLDTTENSMYFGKIVDVEEVAGETGKLLVKISATAKFRNGTGYVLGGKRLAVGSEFANLRCGEVTLSNVSVVSLAVNGGK